MKCKEYFEKNQVIAEAYRFISGVIQYIKGQIVIQNIMVFENLAENILTL